MSKPKGKSLVIVESPAKAETIKRFLGEDYRVEASFGHIRDLPENAKEIPEKVKKQPWARLGVDVENGYEPLYVVSSKKKKYVTRLKDALKDAETLYLATDEDREGESISWHIVEVLKPPKDIPVGRIVFHEVTPEAIQEALQKPRGIDENLVKAQEARRVLDRLYGYVISPILWRKVAKGLSAGRVQSVAVKFCVDRERERMAFRSAEYWDVSALLDSGDGKFKAKLTRIGPSKLADGTSFDPKTGSLKDTARKLLGEKEADEIASLAKEARPWTVEKLDIKPAARNPSPPFITSTLQQEANRKLRMTSRTTMQIAQTLYEGVDIGGERVGLITYMRTDSVHMAQRAVQQARDWIEKNYGKDFVPSKPPHYKTKTKRAEEAHEAIRPTDIFRLPQDMKKYLTDDQFRLYEIIWKRTVASQMSPAKFEDTVAEINVEVQNDIHVFTAKGRTVIFPGFLRAYVEGSDDPEEEISDTETPLPKLQLHQNVTPIELNSEKHNTKPPARYTEASLVKRLEEEGIGRPSTYATIIGTIQDRGYIVKRKNELVPTFTAFVVTEFMEKSFEDLVNPNFTAKMEDQLDDIAEGKQQAVNVLDSFYKGDNSRQGIEQRANQNNAEYPNIEIGSDPVTGEKLVVKVGKYGPYVQRGEGGKDKIASIPALLAPEELTPEVASQLFSGKEQADEPVAKDEENGMPIYKRMGRYGAYLERALTSEEEEKKEKPKRVTIPKDLTIDEVDEETAKMLMSLPRSLGKHPEDSKEIITGLGRFGPFLKHGDEFRSLESWRQVCEITLDEAIEILKQPKSSRFKQARAKKSEVIKEFGKMDGAQGVVKLMTGRYGPYVSDGKTNASIPKGSTLEDITPERALELIISKRNK